MDINMAPYVEQKGQAEKAAQDKAQQGQPGLKYVLVGAVIHRGLTCEAGALFSLTRLRPSCGKVSNSDKWVRSWDENCDVMSHTEAQNYFKGMEGGFNMANVVSKSCKKGCKPMDCKCKASMLHKDTDTPEWLVYERVAYNLEEAHSWPAHQKYNHPSMDESTTVDKEGRFVRRNIKDTYQPPWQVRSAPGTEAFPQVGASSCVLGAASLTPRVPSCGAWVGAAGQNDMFEYAAGR